MYLRIKRDKRTWTSIGLGKKNKLKRAIDQPMVIRISESGKLLLVDFASWNPESLALEFNDCNPKSITWNPECPEYTYNRLRTEDGFQPVIQAARKKNSFSPRVRVEPMRFWLPVQMLYH